MSNRFSYIITYRNSIDRIQPLKRTLEWLSGFSGVEVILVEQDTHSKISHLPLKCNHIFVKNTGPMNKCWGYNIGLKYSSCPVVAFGDSDLIMDPNHFIEGLKAIEKYDYVNPYRSVVDLDPNESNMSFDDIMKISRAGRGENDHQKVPMCGGINIFRRPAIINLGGFCELFAGWGGEDDFQSIKVKNFLTYVEMPYKSFHLYHHRGAPDMTLYQNNLQLLNQFSQLSKDDLQRHIVTSSGTVGLLNKYQ